MVVARHDSPIGKLLITSNGVAITGLYPPGNPRYAALDEEPTGEDEITRDACRQLDAYFASALTRFSLPLGPTGTTFQQRVWKELQRIPYGETISYGELARRSEHPYAARAVGAANGQNPISIIIPCHRVVGADGKAVGYSGGIEAKMKLLDLEARGGQPSLFDGIDE